MATTKVLARRLEVWLPDNPVSVNRAYCRGGRGGVYLSKAARAWKAYVLDVVGYEALAAGFPTHERLRAATISYRIQMQRGDADNYIKLMQDAIADALGVNDRIFSVGGAVREWRDGSRPGVWITIEATEVAA